MIDHRPCTSEPQCIALNSDMDHYTPAHTESACQCEVLAIDYEQLVTILKSDDVPLVRIKAVGTVLSLELERRTKKTKYTAISHVWADGLGNPAVNGVPRCQAERLDSCLSELGAGVRTMVLNFECALDFADVRSSLCSGLILFAYLLRKGMRACVIARLRQWLLSTPAPHKYSSWTPS